MGFILPALVLMDLMRLRRAGKWTPEDYPALLPEQFAVKVRFTRTSAWWLICGSLWVLALAAGVRWARAMGVPEALLPILPALRLAAVVGFVAALAIGAVDRSRAARLR